MSEQKPTPEEVAELLLQWSPQFKCAWIRETPRPECGGPLGQVITLEERLESARDIIAAALRARDAAHEQELSELRAEVERLKGERQAAFEFANEKQQSFIDGARRIATAVAEFDQSIIDKDQRLSRLSTAAGTDDVDEMVKMLVAAGKLPKFMAHACTVGSSKALYENGVTVEIMMSLDSGKTWGSLGEWRPSHAKKFCAAIGIDIAALAAKESPNG